jgi:hypothetical protein
MFFWKRKTPWIPPQPLIHVFVRYCNYSSVSFHKKRPCWFSKEACHRNLLETSDERVKFTYFLDTASVGDHFIQGQAIEIKEGTEAGSFLRMLDFVEKLPLHPETIIYFLEDDYLHAKGWVDVLFEGFSLDADYVTLYDHKDKYLNYPTLRSQILLTPSTHWRTTPSTTNTYAMRFKTLQKHLPIHRRFSEGRKISADHEKFCCLGRKGSKLISPIPGWSTHADVDFESPFFKENVCKPLH